MNFKTCYLHARDEIVISIWHEIFLVLYGFSILFFLRGPFLDLFSKPFSHFLCHFLLFQAGVSFTLQLSSHVKKKRSTYFPAIWFLLKKSLISMAVSIINV